LKAPTNGSKGDYFGDHPELMLEWFDRRIGA